MNRLLLGAAGNSFSPISIPNLILWLDANNASNTPYNNNDPVGTWNDRSSFNWTATAAGAARPTFKTSILNGLPGIFFNGTANGMSIPTNTSLNISTGATFFFVASVTTTTGFQRVISKRDTTTGLGYGIGQIGGSTLYTSYGYGEYFPVTSQWTANVPQIATIFYNNAAYAMFYKNGQLIDTLFSSAEDISNDSGPLLIGVLDNSSQWWSGYIHEVLVYSSNLSNTNQQAVQSYLSTKWGIALTP